MTVANPTALDPVSFGLALSEIQTILFDFTTDLEPGESVATYSAVMSNVDDGTVLALTGSLLPVGTTKLQLTLNPTQDGAIADTTYRLRITYNALPSPDVFVRDLIVQVVG